MGRISPEESCLVARSALLEGAEEVLLGYFSLQQTVWKDGGVFTMRHAVIIFILVLSAL